MAGITLAVKIDDREVRHLLGSLLVSLGDMRRPMATIGEIVVESVQRNFEEQRAPDGTPWQPLSPSYARWKAKKGRSSKAVLILNRVLMGSIHRQANTDHVKIGTNVVYAAIHQFGGRIVNRSANRTGTRRPIKSGRDVFAVRRGSIGTVMPARPFLGVRREDWEEISDVLTRHLKKE